MANEDTRLRREPEGRDDERAKKPYSTPLLTVHGDVEKLTQSFGNGTADFPDGSTDIH
jgi:hypothetical protein